MTELDLWLESCMLTLLEAITVEWRHIHLGSSNHSSASNSPGDSRQDFSRLLSESGKHNPAPGSAMAGLGVVKLILLQSLVPTSKSGATLTLKSFIPGKPYWLLKCYWFWTSLFYCGRMQMTLWNPLTAKTPWNDLLRESHIRTSPQTQRADSECRKFFTLKRGLWEPLNSKAEANF